MFFRREKRKIPVKRFFKGSRVLKVIIFFVLFIFFIILFWSPVLSVSKLEIETDENCLKKEKLEAESRILGRPIFSLREDEIRKRIKQSASCVLEVEIFRQFPNKVFLKVTKREPAVVGFSAYSKKVRLNLVSLEATSSSQGAKLNFQLEDRGMEEFLMDKTGFIFAERKNYKGEVDTSLARVGFENLSFKVGERVKEEVIGGIILVHRKLGEMGVESNSVKVLGDKYLLISGKPNIAFLIEAKGGKNTEESLNFQIATLQLILQEAKMNSLGLSSEGANPKEIESIDLRFDKPVMVYSSKKKE